MTKTATKPAKTIAEAKNPVNPEKPEPKQSNTKVQVPTEDNVVQYLKSLNINLSDEQKKQVELHVRMRATRIGKSYVRGMKAIPEGMKLGPQERALFDAISDEPIGSVEWASKASEALNTRQDPLRVLNFYKRSLEAKGLIKAV